MISKDKITSLYDGKYTLEYKDNVHRYKVNGKPIKGVTTIISKILAKNGLMLWPLNLAIKHLEKCLDKGITLDDLLTAKMAHILAKDKGAGTGTTVHMLAEKLLKDEPYDLLDYDEEVIRSIESLEQWVANKVPEVLATEQIVYSESLDYAGMFDSLLKVDGKVYLVDLKTTNASKDAPCGVYPEHFIQLGAYAKAYTEQLKYESSIGINELPVIDDLMVLSAKKDGTLHTVTASELGVSIDDCIHMWECMYNLFTTLNKLSEKIRGNKYAKKI